MCISFDTDCTCNNKSDDHLELTYEWNHKNVNVFCFLLQIVRWANLITQLVTFSVPPTGRRKFCYMKNSACPIGPDRLKTIAPLFLYNATGI